MQTIIIARIYWLVKHFYVNFPEFFCTAVRWYVIYLIVLYGTAPRRPENGRTRFARNARTPRGRRYLLFLRKCVHRRDVEGAVPYNQPKQRINRQKSEDFCRRGATARKRAFARAGQSKQKGRAATTRAQTFFLKKRKSEQAMLAPTWWR